MSQLPAHLSFPTGPGSRPCPACGGASSEQLYALRAIPTQSCVLLDDREAATRFPTGDMRLVLCLVCGFVFNEAFEPRKVDYREGYEETQGCSGTFRGWLEALADELIARSSLRGGTALEVGCGRGDFLELLAGRAEARGVGIDPSSTAGRVPAGTGLGLEFRREDFGPRHLELEFDLLACRHTLEHLPQVRAFLELAAAALARNPGAPLFLEVPDTLRLFTEGAFWDIYYEHCSYFTRGSLARLLARAGLVAGELRLAYAEQYVQAWAHAPSAPAATVAACGASASEVLDTPAQLAELARAFRRNCEQTLGRWHARLEGWRAAGECVCLWGSGSKATGFLTTLETRAAVAAVVDINPAKHGKFVAGSGHEIVAPERLRALRPDRVVVMNPIYRREIAADLLALGLEPRLETL